MTRALGLALAVLALPLAPACTITQTAHAVSIDRARETEICVVDNPGADPEFLPAFTAALAGKGFTVSTLAAGSAVEACPLAATFDADWSWDFVSYMSRAEIVIYRDGMRAGDALYDSPPGGWALTTRIYEKTSLKIQVMVDQLFPDLGEPALHGLSSVR